MSSTYEPEVLARLERDAKEIIARYPRPRSALLPMLHLVQSETGYITDAGVRYPLTDAAATALGYGELVPEFLPHTLLDLLPSGPALDPGLVAVPTAHTGVRMSGCAP